MDLVRIGPRRAVAVGRSKGTSGEELMGRVEAGRTDAFAELYDLYCDRAYCLALSLCDDRRQAEDAVYEAFVSIWTQRASYTARSAPVERWLLATVRERALEKSRRDHAKLLEPGIHDGSVSRMDGNSAGASILSHGLQEPRREIISLALSGLSVQDIAIVVSLPPSTVKRRMHLGLQQLAEASRASERQVLP